jgi:hypothetical protein
MMQMRVHHLEEAVDNVAVTSRKRLSAKLPLKPFIITELATRPIDNTNFDTKLIFLRTLLPSSNSNPLAGSLGETEHH